MTLRTQQLLLSDPRNLGGLDMQGASYLGANDLGAKGSEVQARIVECPDFVKPMGRPHVTAPIAAVNGQQINGQEWSVVSNQGETT